MGILSTLGRILNGPDRADIIVSTGNRYRGVEVRPGEGDCCSAVRAIRGKRFLSNEVPPLPLPECDARKCRCTYELFADRRRSSAINSGLPVDHAVGAAEPVTERSRQDEDRAA